MQIKFLGAAQEVTGSCFLVDTGSRRVLVDCGLIQGDPKHEARNRSAFPFAARSVDAVVLSHAHLDHSGRLPLLVKAGFSGPIYTHAASRDLCRIM
ncbi:MAG: MBL fold metallo-hydrolase, partial [Pseudomonadota bacterium]